jgi:AcrR family transcriptional regulator
MVDMPRDSSATRTRIYAAAYALFYRKGFQRTSLDDVAAKAGVTKRTLYYHVRSKDDLAGAMLAHQHGFVLAEMARWAEKAGKGSWTGSGFTRMAMELADLPGHPARMATRRHKSEVQAELARCLASCGARKPHDLAAQIQILLEGAMALILIHGDARYANVAGAAARQLVMRR